MLFLKFVAAVAAVAVLSLGFGGCMSSPRDDLYRPHTLTSPTQQADPAAPDELWAVLPPLNESGTTAVDPLSVGDAIVASIQQVQGLSALSMNRTLQSMAALDLGPTPSLSPADIRMLAEAMGVDAVVVPSITAYNPYDPPVFGLTLALQRRDTRLADDSFDPRRLVRAPVDPSLVQPTTFATRPTSVVSAHLDAQNHAVLAAVRSYAVGRHDPTDALAWRKYTASMPLFTEFATQYTVRRLLERETPPSTVASVENP
ncbi:MAG: hypothetical protein AAF747_08285 [Planctomycetota bacterium]